MLLLSTGQSIFARWLVMANTVKCYTWGSRQEFTSWLSILFLGLKCSPTPSIYITLSIKCQTDPEMPYEFWSPKSIWHYSANGLSLAVTERHATLPPVIGSLAWIFLAEKGKAFSFRIGFFCVLDKVWGRLNKQLEVAMPSKFTSFLFFPPFSFCIILGVSIGKSLFRDRHVEGAFRRKEIQLILLEIQ